MKTLKAWLHTKFEEACVCSSGRPYRVCCFRRECVYFGVGAGSALCLFGASLSAWLLLPLPFLLVGAFVAKVWFDRFREACDMGARGTRLQ